MPFIERLKEITEKNYNVPGNPTSDGDLEEIVWIVNHETEDVVTINGESGDDDDDVNDYNDNDNAGAPKMAVA